MTYLTTQLPTDLSTNLPTASTSGDFIGTLLEGRGVQKTLFMSIKNYKKQLSFDFTNLMKDEHFVFSKTEK